MGDGLARRGATGSALLPGAQDVLLHLALEEVRLLAAQSKLLALNAALESAAACRDAEACEEMVALGRSAGQAAAEADGMAKAVELLLLQIRSSAALSEPL